MYSMCVGDREGEERRPITLNNFYLPSTHILAPTHARTHAHTHYTVLGQWQ